MCNLATVSGSELLGIDQVEHILLPVISTKVVWGFLSSAFTEVGISIFHIKMT